MVLLLEEEKPSRWQEAKKMRLYLFNVQNIILKKKKLELTIAYISKILFSFPINTIHLF